MITRLLFVLYFVALLACTSACSDMNRTQINTDSQSVVQQQAGTLPAILIRSTIAEYPLPQPRSGLMRPAVDHQGRVWVAEMGNNALALFDPHTQTFQQMTPPHAQDGLMAVLIAPDDTVWYSEQFANYIGHYDPPSHRYQEFYLPTVKIPDPDNKHNSITLPSAPNDLAIDTHGNIWFTEMNTDSIGKLDVKTGRFIHYPLIQPRTVQKYSPYGITIDRQNNVWFTEASTNKLGRLDPTTGKIQFFTLPGPSNPLMEVTSDSHGTIWATTFDSGTLLKFDPQHTTFSTYRAPNADKGISGMYGLTITPSDEIWVTIPASNVIARFDANAKRFIYYQIPTENSSPLGVAYDTGNTIWFTESTGNRVGKLKP